MSSKPLCLASSLALMGLAPSPALAMKMPDYDITSLVCLSKDIVLVERFEKGTPQNPNGTWCRVKKVYKGSLLPGFELPLPGLSSYAFKLSDERWDPEMFLFFEGKSGAGGKLVTSGVKLLSKGRVYRSIQASNPGLYKPFPQTREASNVQDEDMELPQSALKLAAFEKDLRWAIARVSKLEAAKQSRDVRALLDLLGPPRETPVFGGMRSWEGLFSDAFTPATLLALFQNADDETVIEAAARCKALKFLGLDEWPLKEDRLLEEAKNASVPLHRRVAALRILLASSGALWKTQTHLQVVPLLKDPEAEIRQAAVNYLGEVLPSSKRQISPAIPAAETAPLVEAVWQAWRVERDPLVRTAILGAFNDELAVRESHEKNGSPILFEGCIRDMTAYSAYVFADGHDRAAHDMFVVAVPAAGGPERRVSLRERGRWDSDQSPAPDPKTLSRSRQIAKRHTYVDYGNKRLESDYVDFDPPLTPGKYRTWLEGQYSKMYDPTLKTPDGVDSLTVRTTAMEVEFKQ